MIRGGVEAVSASLRRPVVALGLLLAVTAVAYVPAIDGELVFDDLAIREDPLVADPSAFAHPATWLSAYRPLTTATYAIDRALHGFAPLGWHVTSLVLHLVAVVLAFCFARRLLRRAGVAAAEGCALAVAAVFALHPLQTESVSYLWQRAEVLGSALYLAALLALLAADDAASRAERRGLAGAALLLQALALLAKPVAVTIPVAWLLVQIVLPGPGEEDAPARLRWARAARRALPGIALSAVAAVAWIGGVEAERAGVGAGDGGRLRYLASQLVALPTYLRLLVWPAGQNVDWPVPDPATDLAQMLLGGVALAAVAGAIGLAAWRSRRDPGSRGARRVLLFGAAWLVVLVAPTSGAVPLRDAIVEHRMYLPLLALALAAAPVLSTVGVVRARRSAAVAVAVGLAAALAITTAVRNAVWASALSLWSDAAEKSPEKSRPQMNYGIALLEAGDAAAAAERLERAWTLRADGTIPPAGRNGALLRSWVASLYVLGREEEAVRHAEAALAASPRDVEALVTFGQLAQVRGRLDEAADAAAAALAIDPEHAAALALAGGVRLDRGELPGAAELLGRSLVHNPGDPFTLRRYAAAALQLGDLPGACEALGRALALSASASAAEIERERALARCP